MKTVRASVMPGPRRRLGPRLVLASLGLAATGTVLTGASATRSDARVQVIAAPSASGGLVNLPDRRRLNLRCSGRGAPTVLLESGFGADSGAWYKVQPLVARRTRVCAYDRAGYGLSDPGPMPRDGRAIARDLDQALRAANEPGPYIAVGHSAGGLYVRIFAARRLSDMAGLVLVDPSVEYQDRRLAAIFGPGAGSVVSVRSRAANCLQATEAHPSAPLDLAVAACLPGEEGPSRAAAMRPALWRTQLSEIDTLFTTTSDQVTRTNDVLRRVPAIVLTASRAGDNAEATDIGEQTWQAFHRELAGNFHQGAERTVKSSHMMMLDRPEVIAAAIDELVRARQRRAAKVGS